MADIIYLHPCYCIASYEVSCLVLVLLTTAPQQILLIVIWLLCVWGEKQHI